jgi:tRNA uridine 5-carboxymethylaminomethyl modification enzyme
VIPNDLEFGAVPGLSNEIKQKLRQRQPRSLADAQKIDGMTPAALAIIVSYVRQAERAA